jgi:hypothetical protein
LGIKKILIPNGETKGLEALDTWVVSWYCVHEGFVSLTREKRYQAFTNIDEANAFKKSLVDANKILGNTGYTDEEVKLQKSGL